MIIASPRKNLYFYDYALWQALPRDIDPRVGRRIRKEIFRTRDLAHASMRDAHETFHTVWRAHHSTPLNLEPADWTRYRQTYARMIGNNGDTLGRDNVLPLSPYHPVYGRREWFTEAKEKNPLYMLRGDDTSHPFTTPLWTPSDVDGSIYTTKDSQLWGIIAEKQGAYAANQLMDDTPHVLDEARVQGVLDCMEWLENHGREYHFEKNKLVLDDSHTFINLDNTYFGSVYAGGARTYIGSTLRDRDTRLRAADMPRMLAHALGEPIVNDQGEPIDGRVRRTRIIGRNTTGVNTCYFGAGRQTLNIGIARRAGGETDFRGNGLNIVTVNTSGTRITNPELAQDILRSGQNRAKETLVRRMNLDQLLTHGTEDTFPLDVHPLISEAQKHYRAFLKGDIPTLTLGNIIQGQAEGVTQGIKNHMAEYITHCTGGGETLNPQTLVDFAGMKPQEVIDLIKTAGIPAKNLIGDSRGYYIDHLIEAGSPKENLTDFDKHILGTVRDTLTAQGVIPGDITLDDAGIITWKGRVHTQEKSEELTEVTGVLGQIFTPDDQGVIHTKFAGGHNYDAICGYNATILEGEGSVEERTRLWGYRDLIDQRIKQTLAWDCSRAGYQGVRGSATSLNTVYATLPIERMEENFRTHLIDKGVDPELIDAMITTKAGRVRYSNDVKTGATVFASLGKSKVHAPIYDLCDRRNMAIIDENSDGYFDPYFTQSTGDNQGIVRYLASSARVEDHKIIPGDKDARCPLFEREEFKHSDHDSFACMCMSANALRTARNITQPVGYAQVSLGGFNTEDGIVVSKNFAKTYDCELGDKLIDFHGNKGVISLIVDPQMSLDKADTQEIKNIVQWFKNNPDCDIVANPFSNVSRLTGGIAREIMDRERKDLRDINGTLVPQSLGQLRYIITDKTAESKTHTYDDNSGARHASHQFEAALEAVGATKTLREIYANTTDGEIAHKLGSLGIRLGADGSLTAGVPLWHKGNIPHIYLRGTRANTQAMLQNDKDWMCGEAYTAPIAFPLTLDSGITTPKIGEYTRANDTINVYGFPVMDAKYRYVRTQAGDSIVGTEYNSPIEGILKDSYKVFAGEKNPEDVQKIAQSRYQNLRNKIYTHDITGKRNMFRLSLRAPLEHGATSLWIPDPRLDIDEITIGKDLSRALNVNSGDTLLIWRDPILSPGGLRSMVVKNVNNDLHGLAINPACVKSFEGDFDGDTVGVARFSQKVMDELNDKLSPIHHLVNMTQPGEEKPLYFELGTDAHAGLGLKPALRERQKELTQAANRVEDSHKEALGKDISDHIKNCYAASCGSWETTTRYDTQDNHIASIKKLCELGHKGSESALEIYERNVRLDDDPLRREDIKEQQIANAIKIHGTGLAGMYQQRAIAALRGRDLDCALALTAPVTQALLQAKNNVQDAVDRYQAIGGASVLRKLYKGEAYNDNGQVVSISKEQWVEKMNELYHRTPQDGGLGIPLDKKIINHVGEVLSAQGSYVTSIEDTSHMSTFDQLCYYPDGETFRQAVKNASILWDTPETEVFRPRREIVTQTKYEK